MTLGMVELNILDYTDGLPVIDFHAHAFPEKIADPATKQLAEHYRLTIGRAGTYDDLLESAKEAGVARLCIHMAATNEKQVEVGNSWIAEHLSENIIGFGSLHLNYKDFIKELDRMETMGITGVKLHADFQGFAIDDPGMWPIYEAIGERFLVMFHVGDRQSGLSLPSRLRKVLDHFPAMKIIAAHLGGFARWTEARESLLGKNLWVDTSSTTWMLPPEEIARLIRSHDPQKVLFGTDYPIVSHLQELKAFSKIPLTTDEREKILWRNAANLLKTVQKRKTT